MVELVVRLVVSLAVVLGLLVLLTRLSARRMRGRSGSAIQVLHRQQLTRSSSVAVVTVGSRVLVLGTTEQQVQLLTELDATELDAPDLVTAQPSTALPPTPDEPPLLQHTPKHRAEPPFLPGVAPAGRAARQVVVAAQAADRAPATSALAGSVLSPQTWRQALAVATSRQQDAS